MEDPGAVSRHGQHRLASGPARPDRTSDTVDVAQVFDQPGSATLAHRLHAELDPTTTPGGALLQPLRSLGKRPVDHVPDSQCQRGQRLDDVWGDLLLAVAPVHDLTQLTQLG